MPHFHAWFQRVHLENLFICLPVSSPYSRANLWSPREECHHAVLQYPLLKESPPPEFWPFFLSCHWLSWSQKLCPHPWPCTKDFLSVLSPPPLSAKVTLTTFFVNPLWAFQGIPIQPTLPQSCNITRPYPPQNKTWIFHNTSHKSLFQDSVFKNYNS